jgi:hypothetical protein
MSLIRQPIDSSHPEDGGKLPGSMPHSAGPLGLAVGSDGVTPDAW